MIENSEETKVAQPTKTGTKLVEVRLSALTRQEHMEVIEVPVDITRQELNDLVNQRYMTVDGGQFSSDPDYWERSSCYAFDSEQTDAKASLSAFRTAEGLLVERAEAEMPETNNSETPTWLLCKGGAFNSNECLRKLHDQLRTVQRMIRISNKALVGVIFGSVFESHPNLQSVKVVCSRSNNSYYVELVSAMDDEGLECAAQIQGFGEIDDDEGAIFYGIFGDEVVTAERSRIAEVLLACGPEGEIDGAVLYDLLFPVNTEQTPVPAGDGGCVVVRNFS